jgi:hypothetical protein
MAGTLTRQRLPGERFALPFSTRAWALSIPSVRPEKIPFSDFPS